MNWFVKLFRFFFLVKEIISKAGEAHFRRYRFLETPWLRLYLHQISVSDYEAHFHDHPWHFMSFLLKGSYKEDWTFHPDHDGLYTKVWKAGQMVKHHAQDFHKITLQSPEVWTFVIAWGPRREWGYYLSPIDRVGHEEYRRLKHEGKLP